MIFSLSIIAIFVAASVYFFFQAEGLNRQLVTAKRESVTIKKENKAFVDTMAIVAKRNEEFLIQRLNKLKETKKQNEVFELIQPVIHNYSAIFLGSLKGKGQVQKMVKKCCDGYEAGCYKNITTYIAKQDAQIKRMWSSNNLSGFMKLVDELMQKIEK